MELFLVLISFSILFYGMSKILIRSVSLFEEREKYEVKALIEKVEYREKPGTTIYHVEFTDRDGNAIKAQSLQYKGKPIFNKGNLISANHLVRDEMKHLIENELIEIPHPEHKTMSEDLTPKLKKINYISVGFLIASVISLIYWLMF